jgi:hypothetical protein
MRLRYETGIATLVQFSVITLLTFISGVFSVISACTGSNTGSCASNTFVSLLFILLTVIVLGVIAGLGYAAQARRSSRLAQILIAIETVAALIYLFDAKQVPDVVDRITNFLSFLVATWVVVIAWRLMLAKGGRIVKPQQRRRSTPKSQ